MRVEDRLHPIAHALPTPAEHSVAGLRSFVDQHQRTPKEPQVACKHNFTDGDKIAEGMKRVGQYHTDPITDWKYTSKLGNVGMDTRQLKDA